MPSAHAACRHPYLASGTKSACSPTRAGTRPTRCSPASYAASSSDPRTIRPPVHMSPIFPPRTVARITAGSFLGMVVHAANARTWTSVPGFALFRPLDYASQGCALRCSGLSYLFGVEYRTIRSGSMVSTWTNVLFIVDYRTCFSGVSYQVPWIIVPVLVEYRTIRHDLRPTRVIVSRPRL